MATEGIGLLVIGIGNELRGDDGAGRVVADRIDDLNLPKVTVRSVTQLVPELAVELADAERVMFVDADATVGSLAVRRIEGGSVIEGADDCAPSGAATHHSTPASLVGLAVAVGSRVPSLIEQLSIPTAGFEFGAPMSAVTVAAVEEAVELIVERAANG